MEKKRFFFRKGLIILLSLVIMLNGLGLIIAGKKVGKKNWVFFGWAYIAIEWICAITGVGVMLASILYFASIIHTALICSEYGRLLNEQFGTVSKKQKTDEMKNKINISEKEVDGNGVNILDRIPLKIGTAEVSGMNRNYMQITVKCDNGKVYEFDTAGNAIESFSINGKMYSYGG